MKVKLIATDKGYYNDEIIREGQTFTFEVSEKLQARAEKKGLKLADLIPPWAEPVGSLPAEAVVEVDDEMTDDEREAKIIAVVGSLDHTDDDHWTEAGLPEVAAVRELCGFKVSRADIKALCPGVEREDQ